VLLEAVRCFEEAIRLRTGLPLQMQPWYRWGFTAGWMNRAEALSRLGRHEEASSSYDRALDQLQQLPLEMEPAFRWRLGLAWMNRALTLQALGYERVGMALESLDESIRVLSHVEMTTMRDRGTFGCAWMNHAAVLMESQPAQPMEALESATHARFCLQPFERIDVIAAEAALKARLRSRLAAMVVRGKKGRFCLTRRACSRMILVMPMRLPHLQSTRC